MNKSKPPTFKISISTHLVLYIALYFIGFFVGFQAGWVIAIILTGLNIIQPPLHVLVIFLVLFSCVYFPNRMFAKRVPAICPSCGGTALLHHVFFEPLRYVCTDCGQSHKTGLSLSGR
jgi:hypothetical protein